MVEFGMLLCRQWLWDCNWLVLSGSSRLLEWSSTNLLKGNTIKCLCNHHTHDLFVSQICAAMQ